MKIILWFLIPLSIWEHCAYSKPITQQSFNNYDMIDSQDHFEMVVDLILNYSYKDEIAAKVSKIEYHIVKRMEDILCNDSVYIKLTKQEIKVISYLFLKKRAISMVGYSIRDFYLANMRLWPGNLVTFCINTVLEIDKEGSMPMETFLNQYGDYACVKILLDLDNEAFKEINDQFVIAVKDVVCDEP